MPKTACHNDLESTSKPAAKARLFTAFRPFGIPAKTFRSGVLASH